MRSVELTEQHSAKETFGFHPDQDVVLVLGGSQGAEAVNRHLARAIEWYSTQENIGILWQCGERHLRKYAQYTEGEHGIQVVGFIQNMAEAYSACSLIVARAGALTISELGMVGKPSILIPLPTAAANHQLYNAESYARRGAAVVIQEHELPTGLLEEMVETILTDRPRYEAMAAQARSTALSDATENIVEDIVTLAKRTTHVSKI